MTRSQVVKSLAFPELKVAVVGDAAIARHIYLSECLSDTAGGAAPRRERPRAVNPQPISCAT